MRLPLVQYYGEKEGMDSRQRRTFSRAGDCGKVR